jgi:hypothetical protein
MSRDLMMGSPLGIWVEPPSPLACVDAKELSAELIRALVQAFKEGGINGLFVGNGLSDCKRIGEVDGGRQHGPAASLEGFIEMTPPFKSSELERGSNYTRINFRASLAVRIEGGDASGDKRADCCTGDGGNACADFHGNPLGSESNGCGDPDSTTGQDSRPIPGAEGAV